MKTILIVAAFMTIHSATSVHADSFGIGDDAFEIEFLTVGAPGNAADTSGNPASVGSVPYLYRIGTYEISEGLVNKANRLGSLGLTPRNDGSDKPARVGWYQAARFVNWLNVSTGHHPAYKFAQQPGDADYFPSDGFQEWLPADDGYDPMNLFRNRQARYFLPNMDEWYKAAYFDPDNGVYYDFPTGSDAVPDGIDFEGDIDFDAVFSDGFKPEQAMDVMNAGAASPSGTVGQGGNVWEWQETEWDLVNDEPECYCFAYRGGAWTGDVADTNALNRSAPGRVFLQASFVGFRVASRVVPEPSTAAMLLAAAIFWLTLRLRLNSCRQIRPALLSVLA